jgi:redox-sensitive bicupin YhaK (pirin superfamily)
MKVPRWSQDRGQADHGWLRSFHSFSFADYIDPQHMGFGNLRVINEDVIAPGTGFGTHGHRDMEIITYIVSGELAHKDSMGNGEAGASNSGVIRPGDVQRMSAGHGVRHSEFNHSAAPTHLLQIWIQPNQFGIEPSYEQKHFAAEGKRGRLRLVASPDGREDSVKIHADASMHVGLFDGEEAITLSLAEGRQAYVQLVRGRLEVNGETLSAGDALKLSGESEVVLRHEAQDPEAEVLVFDLTS